ncbi:MAG: PKD domain protein, partial [Flavobacteriaceae bacterium]
MKTFKYLLSCSIVILAFINCSDDEANFDYLKTVAPPTNVTAVFQVTQDNTGVVTITPNSDGATKYTVYFGDDTPEPVEV